MNRGKRHTGLSRRRGTVLVLVVGILALLFIIGATSLMLMRFERQNVYTHATVRNLEAVAAALMNPVIAQLRKDVVGDNGTPYDRGWGGDTSELEDYADFAGFRSGKGIRNGDLLLSSIEPYYDGDKKQYRWPYLSWGYDAVLTGGTAPAESLIRGQRVYTTGGPRLDVSGDGLRDGIESPVFAGLSAMFGGNYQTLVRVIPHGGMVLLDPYTHPALLTQVIHPKDATYFNNPTLLWTTGGLTTDPLTDESNLRRRYFLPPLLEKPADGSDYTTTAPQMVRLLPVTMGYANPSNPADWVNNPIEHWWPIDDTLVAGDDEWWKKRLIAGPGMTDAAYDDDDDWYDRRRLVTTLNSDDVLRRQRGEKLIKDSNSDNADDALASFYYILNPMVNDPADPLNAYKYGIIGGGTELAFNGPGLRTQFSLRDVLEPAPSATEAPYGSYRRAMQLTAYYLAMIQGTYKNANSNPAILLTEPLDQLRTAAQLAVNTIDFADQDPLTPNRSMPSYFAWTSPVDPAVKVEVVGVERQPYLTEAYARLVYANKLAGVTRVWDIDSVENASIYAVELYNPYDTDIDLQDFEIWVGPAFANGFPDDATGASKAQITFNAGKMIPAHSYVVISNKGEAELGLTGLTDANRILFSSADINGDLKIAKGNNVALMRNKVNRLVPDPVPPSPPYETVNKYVMVDILRPVALPALNSEPGPGPASVRILKANSDNWVAPAPDQDALNALSHQPSVETDRLVWGDSSLQRHKEVPGEPPRYWHFTMARQWLFPLQVEVTDEAGTKKNVFYGAPWQFSAAPSGQLLVYDATTPPPMQHSLFGIGPSPTTGLSPNQLLVERDSLSLPVVLSFPNPNTTLTEPVAVELPILEKPLASFPVLCPYDPLKEIAFPTTGTLLLVTRYAHTPDGPVSVAATKEPYESNRLGMPAFNILQMYKLDNGHLPLFDTFQKCADLKEKHGRCDFPWGQLVFDYFTALPLEELCVPRNLDVYGQGASTRMIDLPTESIYDQIYAAEFPGYPIINRVSASASLGAKVRGRININAAPWWVMDGLPMLAEPQNPRVPAAPVDPDDPDELPIRELHSLLLDPAVAGETDPAYWPGQYLMRLLVDDATSLTAAPPRNWTTASPVLAKCVVAHREMREVYDAQGNIEVKLPYGPSDVPGFVSVGGLCDLVPRLGVPVKYKKVGTGSIVTLNEPNPLVYWRDEHTYQLDNDDPNTIYRPFGYIGYLQLVAPVVRLQDWVTTRNHAFTIYGSISTTTDPAIHLRMQTTVDRSPCLYGGTATTIVTEPTGYYNALED